MEITHVIRGEDHISNTPRQVLLYQALGFTPPAFAHLALVMGPDHTPLSKRHGATSVAEFRARGFLPEALTNYLALLGWSPGGDQELLPIDEMARRFAIEDVGHSAGVFDPEKLAWMNRQYMKLATPARLCGRVGALLPRARLPVVVDRTRRWNSRLAAADGDRIGRSARGDSGSTAVSLRVRRGRGSRPRRTSPRCSHEPGAREVIAALGEELGPRRRLDRDAFRAAANRVKQRTGQKGRALFHPIRVALTGEGGGPELDLAVPAIDRGASCRSSAGVAPIIGCRERARARSRSELS